MRSVYLFVALVAASNSGWSQSPLLVDAGATGAQTGSSWTDAFPFLQDALAVAQPGDQIWVAEGTYRPDQGAGQVAGSRASTFLVPSDVRLFGGFAGTETSLAQRAGLFDTTILSGDLNGDDATVGNLDNAYHVVTTSGAVFGALIDGFTITAGNADLFGGFESYGGGIVNYDGRVELRNCIVTGNEALEDGGGLANLGSGGSVLIVACTFRDNLANDVGGGLFSTDASSGPRVVSCRFLGNRATRLGGGVYLFSLQSSSAELVGCLFGGNTASERGGGLFASTDTLATISSCTFSANSVQTGDGGGIFASNALTLVNSVLWGNADANGTVETSQITSSGSQIDNCCVEGWSGGLGGSGNFGDDPQLVDAIGPDGVAGTEDDDASLFAGSPCLDAGDNDRVPADALDVDGDGDRDEPLPLDLAGNERFLESPAAPDVGAGTPPLVDLGAYERSSSPLSADVFAISIAVGGAQTLALDAGPDRAGQFYLLLGSLTGTSPGVSIDAFVLPVNVDSYTLHTLTSPNTPPLTSSFGTLGATGFATATFTLAAGSPATLLGLTANHAYVTLELLPGLLRPTMTSNAVPVDFVP